MEHTQTPLVSIICLCYQHSEYVKKALESVIFQTYPTIELLIVDDASTDKSVEVIEQFIKELPQYQAAFQDATRAEARTKMRVKFWTSNTNQGNCSAFNRALKVAKGKYIIDLAADDVLLDERVAEQVAIFESLPAEYGVIFSNALLIDPDGKVLNPHYPIDAESKSKIEIPQGDIYQSILERYFISTPTMMIKKTVLDELGGYDEALSYEDFDFWVRSSRKFLYHYQDKVTTLKRVLPKSHSTSFYQHKSNPHLASTLKVCRKAQSLNRNSAEHQALIQCVSYHFRQCFFTQNYALALEYYELLEELEKPNTQSKVILFLSKNKVSVRLFYRFYLRVRKWMK